VLDEPAVEQRKHVAKKAVEIEEVEQAEGKDVLEVLHMHISNSGEKKLVTMVNDASDLSVVLPIEKMSDARAAILIMMDKLEWER
jgi:hypothetical protein